ncbi:unnamed protein product [Pleuronectes platessa]|uniref:Uncharacterized protein n=1 Tax=Pleuronectes platessa TaxID=8262 RepID=A0A9N7V3B9_PLEPL|nr:unnamed protein product [Pleuronectes platessa]
MSKTVLQMPSNIYLISGTSAVLLPSSERSTGEMEIDSSAERISHVFLTDTKPEANVIADIIAAPLSSNNNNTIQRPYWDTVPHAASSLLPLPYPSIFPFPQ